MDFVEHDEAVLVSAEKLRRAGKFGPIFAGLKIEIDGETACGDGVGKRGLST